MSQNKHGIVSALISGVLIISFFMPLIDFLFINVSTFKIFSELAKSNLEEQWMGIVFLAYFFLVIINLFVQLIKGNKALSSIVGFIGLGILFSFMIQFNSDKSRLGDFGKIIDITDFIGAGAYVMGASMFALIVVPRFFKTQEDKEFDELIERAEMLSQDSYTSNDSQSKREKLPAQEDVNSSTEKIKKLKEKIAQQRSYTDHSEKAEQPVLQTETKTLELEELKIKKAQLEKEKLEMEIENLKKQIESMKK